MAEIIKVRYTHEAVIDTIVARPMISQNELAAAFGFTPTWMSIIVNSDAFKEKLALRKTELVDPIIQASLNDRLNALASRSAEVLLDKLNAAPDEATALRALDITAKALGYGAKDNSKPSVVNYIAVVPQRSNDSRSWADTYGRTIDSVGDAING